MHAENIKIALLIDYDNLTELQKSSGILDIATRALMQLPKDISETRGKCAIRIYGGWYEEQSMTNLAQSLSVSMQDDFPAIIRIPTILGEPLSLTTNAELARALVEEPSHHLFNTFRKKGRPANVRFLKPEDVGCTNTECSLQVAKNLLRTGRCPSNGCSVTRADLVYRNEQKIVDTMLTCDLLYYSKLEYDHIMLISGDDDFLPPLRTILLRGAKVYRVHPTSSNYRAPIHIAGTQLHEMEL
jgi:uncharacterized LabA/DUF88 family protein